MSNNCSKWEVTAYGERWNCAEAATHYNGG